jgi:hypothetical protein
MILRISEDLSTWLVSWRLAENYAPVTRIRGKREGEVVRICPRAFEAEQVTIRISVHAKSQNQDHHYWHAHAVKVARGRSRKSRLALVLLVWPPPEHLWIGRNRGPIRALQPCRSMANFGAERFLVDPGSTRPERHFLSGAAQTRIVSAARIRLDSRKSVRPFKGILCDDVCEFESHMPSQPVRSPRHICAAGRTKTQRGGVFFTLDDPLEAAGEVEEHPLVRKRDV